MTHLPLFISLHHNTHNNKNVPYTQHIEYSLTTTHISYNNINTYHFQYVLLDNLSYHNKYTVNIQKNIN